MTVFIPWVDEGADPALAAAGLVGERGHTPVGQLEQDDAERPDVGLEPNLDPRLGNLGQDAVLVPIVGGKRLRAEVVLGAAHEGPRDEIVAGQGVGGEPEVDQLCEQK